MLAVLLLCEMALMHRTVIELYTMDIDRHYPPTGIIIDDVSHRRVSQRRVSQRRVSRRLLVDRYCYVAYT